MMYLISPRDVNGEEDQFNIIGDKEQYLYYLNNHLYSTISRGYETFEEMVKGEELTGEPCRICGEPHFPTKYGEVGKILREKNICFTCNHWEEQDKMTGRKKIIINGSKFADGGNKESRLGGWSGLGFGGHRFYIKFLESGEVFTTNNLWAQGKISKAFRERMPDNAIYLTKEQYESETINQREDQNQDHQAD